MSNKTVLYIREIVQETADTITIHFAQPEHQFDYLSGQFLTLISEIDGKEERRAYSLCSSPYIDKDLSVTIKRVKNGKMSNHLNDNLKAGDKIGVLPPTGNFNFKPTNGQRHIVLIGGGSGITPLFSIIKSALTKEPASILSLIYVNANRENTIFYKQLEQWSSKFPSRFRIVYYWGDEWKNERPKSGFWSRIFTRRDVNAHRINPVRLKAIFSDLQLAKDTDSEFYICGPQGLMEMAAATIREIGFSKEVVSKENFYTVTKTTHKPVKTQQEHQVKILFKGKEYQVNVVAGKPILFAGLESGIDLPFSCQSGNCTSCAGKCVSGQVGMSTTEGLTEEQIKDGYVLACVGYPKTDDVVIEFN
ncbi:MAG TPA: ferredoxin--NADP reductase [Aquaticitalea sp.]|nr:ferredoxin--NADP reductase [Aquaticitalea sp.]